MTEIGDELPIFFLHFVPVHPMKILDVEPVSVDSPPVFEDLSPFFQGIDLHR